MKKYWLCFHIIFLYGAMALASEDNLVVADTEENTQQYFVLLKKGGIDALNGLIENEGLAINIQKLERPKRSRAGVISDNETATIELIPSLLEEIQKREEIKSILILCEPNITLAAADGVT